MVSSLSLSYSLPFPLTLYPLVLLYLSRPFTSVLFIYYLALSYYHFKFLHYFSSVSPCAYSLFLNCFFSHCLLLNILILLTLFSFCFSLQFNSIYYTISLLCPPLHVPFSHFFLSLLIALNSLHFSLDPLSTYLPR